MNDEKKDGVPQLLEELQQELLADGARLPSLDPQKQRGKRNNKIEGKDYLQPKHHEGKQLNMTTTETGTENKGRSKDVTPAGGKSDEAVTQEFVSLLRKANRALDSESHPRTYGQKALDKAIPTVILAAGVVVAYAGIMVVSNKWGAGKQNAERNNLLAEQNKLLASGIDRSVMLEHAATMV